MVTSPIIRRNRRNESLSLSGLHESHEQSETMTRDGKHVLLSLSLSDSFPVIFSLLNHLTTTTTLQQEEGERTSTRSRSRARDQRLAMCDGSDERRDDDQEDGVHGVRSAERGARTAAAAVAGLSHERDQREVTEDVTGCMRQEWLVTGAREKRETFGDLLRQMRSLTRW